MSGFSSQVSGHDFLQNRNVLVSGRLVRARSGRALLDFFFGFFDSCILTFAITYSKPYLALRTCSIETGL